MGLSLTLTERTLLCWNVMCTLSNLLKHDKTFEKSLAALRCSTILIAPKASLNFMVERI